MPKTGNYTRKAVFIAEMKMVVMWSRLESLIEPFHLMKGNGRLPMPLGTMFLIHFMQQWFGYSAPAMEEGLHDVSPLRRFAELDAFVDVKLNENRILRFLHLLEKHDLAVAIFADVDAILSVKSLSMKRGTLIVAPSSTKNEDKKRDPEMTQTKKGDQWHFGMKEHIGVDADSGLIYAVKCTTAKVVDIAMVEKCQQEGEVIALGDGGYYKKNRTIVAFQTEANLSVMTPPKKPAGVVLTEEQKAFNQMLYSAWAIVEHLFRVVKRQFSFVKVRYCGLAKNAGQIVTSFALADLWMARNRMLPLAGEVCL